MSMTDQAAPPMGHNTGTLPKMISDQENIAFAVTEFLGDQYSMRPKAVAELLEEATTIPTVIEDDATKGRATSLIKRLREEATRLTAFHSKEKDPYYRGGQAVDQWFFALIDKVARRVKTNNPGAADVLLKRVTDYDSKVLAEKQEALRREREKAERIAREARERAEQEEREHAEARAIAERARKPEHIEAKTAVAEQKADSASAAKVNAMIADDKAAVATTDSLRKPADLMRTRDESTGTLSTMTTEKYADIIDRDALDKEKLWPHIPTKALEQAVRSYAATTDYKVGLVGATIGRRPKSQVR